MRVEGPNSAKGVGAQKKMGKASGGFALPDASDSSAASQSSSVSAGAAVQSLDALLALQSVESNEDKTRRAVRHGHDLLDQLEALRADLLAGHVAPHRVGALLSLIRAKQETADGDLDGLLEDISLRARVELAKLGIDP